MDDRTKLVGLKWKTDLGDIAIVMEGEWVFLRVQTPLTIHQQQIVGPGASILSGVLISGQLPEVIR